jgi:hypothetical protein
VIEEVHGEYAYQQKERRLVRRNLRFARSRWRRNLGVALERSLAVWSGELRVSIERGDLLLIEGKWYVTHSGFLRLAGVRSVLAFTSTCRPNFVIRAVRAGRVELSFTSPPPVKASSAMATLIPQMSIR